MGFATMVSGVYIIWFLSHQVPSNMEFATQLNDVNIYPLVSLTSSAEILFFEWVGCQRDASFYDT